MIPPGLFLGVSLFPKQSWSRGGLKSEHPVVGSHDLDSPDAQSSWMDSPNPI